MQDFKILNICSAIGNIGDDASHVGLKTILAKTLAGFRIEKLEIRDFYASEPAHHRKIFDEELAKYINQFDLCFIGGGSYLDYPVIGSTNGPTIDFSDGFLNEIRTKVLISSVSCRAKCASEAADQRLVSYFEKLSSHPTIEILLRNDGSIENLERIGIKRGGLTQILDHGFFIRREDLVAQKLENIPYYCCLNVVSDQLSFHGNNQLFTKKYYFDYIAAVVQVLNTHGFERIVLIPHIYQDLEAIHQVLQRLDRHLISTKIVVSELYQGEYAAMKTFGIYADSALNLGTRFHTNVCSFALNRPTIPISITGRLKALSDSLYSSYDFNDILNNFDSVYDLAKGANKQKIQSSLKDQRMHTLDIFARKLKEFQ